MVFVQLPNMPGPNRYWLADGPAQTDNLPNVCEKVRRDRDFSGTQSRAKFQRIVYDHGDIIFTTLQRTSRRRRCQAGRQP
jgi:hypothetical protein